MFSHTFQIFLNSKIFPNVMKFNLWDDDNYFLSQGANYNKKLELKIMNEYPQENSFYALQAFS